MGKLLLDVTETATLLDICESKVRRMIAAQQLPALRVGRSWRIPLQALERWIEQRVQGGQEVVKEG